ncbi:MAG: choice-of-anchor J domain-containing protein, partial [Verrucomicrobiales bacterium]
IDPNGGTFTGITNDLTIGGTFNVEGATSNGNIRVKDGFTLTLEDDATLFSQVFSAPTNETANIVLSDNAVLTVTQNIARTAFEISGNADIVFSGSGPEFTTDTINLASDWTGTITLVQVTNRSMIGGNGIGLFNTVTIDGVSATETDIIREDLTNEQGTVTGTIFRLFPESPESPEIDLFISQVNDSLDFEWSSTSGMLYDLLSSTDLSTSINTWLPYNDGVTTYENIASSETGTQTLTGVLKDGTKRFFALVEKEAPAFFEEDFEDGNGGFSVVGTLDDWEYGTPNSDNAYGLVLDSSNSTNCWGTNLGDGDSDAGFIDTSADSYLRSPNLDLTEAADATLTFLAAVDASSGDIFELLIKEVGTDTLLDTIQLIDTSEADVTFSWTELGPFNLSAGAGNHIYLEFHFQGDSTFDYIGAYVDDVKIETTTP